MTDRTILLTGATGFVGRHLARRLVAAGHPVAALVRQLSGPCRLPEGAQPVPIPAGGTGALVDTVAQLRPAACVHLATHFLPSHTPDDLEPLLDANVVFGTRLAEALTRAAGDDGPAPLVDTGTVWQHLDGAAYAPANLYAATKQAMADILTAYARHHGLTVARLSLTDTYGPDDSRPKLVPALVRAAQTGEHLPLGSGDQQVDLVHVDDVVEAFVRVVAELARPTGERSLPVAPDGTTTYLVSSGRPLTVKEVVAQAEEAAGRPLPVRWGARLDRPVDAGTPRSPHAPLPGWRPRIELVDGLRRLLGAVGS